MALTAEQSICRNLRLAETLSDCTYAHEALREAAYEIFHHVTSDDEERRFRTLMHEADTLGTRLCQRLDGQHSVLGKPDD